VSLPPLCGLTLGHAAAATSFSQATVKLWPEVFEGATDAQRVRLFGPGSFAKGVAKTLSAA